MVLTGGFSTEDLTSLNGLGTLADQSGHYVNPMSWRGGIRGVGVIPLTHGSLNGLGDLQYYPGSGGSDALVRNPINPGWSAPSCGNPIMDATSDPRPEDVVSSALSLSHVFGMAGLGCASCGGGCGCGNTKRNYVSGGMGALDLTLTGSILPGISASLPKIPNWALLAAVGGILFLGGSSGRRR